jgi:hypothetical protein
MYIVQSIHIWERVQDEKKQERQKCPSGTRQTDGKNWGLVWRNRKKISQIIKDYFHLPFFLLIILWESPSNQNTNQETERYNKAHKEYPGGYMQREVTQREEEKFLLWPS